MSDRAARYEKATGAATAVGALLLLGPLEARDWTISLGPLALTFSEMLAAVAAFAGFVVLAMATREHPALADRLRRRLRGPVVPVLVGWAAIHLISAAWSGPDALDALKFGLRTAGGVALALSTYAWAGERGFAERIERFVFAAIALVFAIAVLERTGGQAMEPFLGVFRAEPTWMLGEQRLSTVFYHANTMAAWVELMLPWALLGAAHRSGKRRLWPALLLLGCIWMLGLTYSRAGLAAAILASGALWLSAATPRWRSLRWLAAGTMVLVAASYLANPDMRARLGLEERGYDVSYAFQGRCAGDPGERVRVPVVIHNVGQWPLSNRQAPGQLAHVVWPEEGRPDKAAFHYQQLPEVGPGEAVTLTIAIDLPEDEGAFDVIVDIRRKNVIWLSAVGVEPGRLHCVAGEMQSDGGGTVDDDETIRLQGRPLELERRHYWQAALRLLAERPVFGHGADRFRMLYRQFVPPRGWDGRARAHSIVVETAADLGALGLLALGLWVGVLLAAVYGLLRQGRAGSRFGLAALVGCSAFLAHSLVDYFLAYTQILVVFWPLLGLGLGLAETARRSHETPSGGPRDG